MPLRGGRSDGDAKSPLPEEEKREKRKEKREKRNADPSLRSG